MRLRRPKRGTDSTRQPPRLAGKAMASGLLMEVLDAPLHQLFHQVMVHQCHFAHPVCKGTSADLRTSLRDEGIHLSEERSEHLCVCPAGGSEGSRPHVGDRRVLARHLRPGITHNPGRIGTRADSAARISCRPCHCRRQSLRAHPACDRERHAVQHELATWGPPSQSCDIDAHSLRHVTSPDRHCGSAHAPSRALAERDRRRCGRYRAQRRRRRRRCCTQEMDCSHGSRSRPW